MKKNAQTATAVIVISAFLLLTVTAETAILLSGIWTREKYTLAFLVLAAGIALVYPAADKAVQYAILVGEVHLYLAPCTFGVNKPICLLLSEICNAVKRE